MCTICNWHTFSPFSYILNHTLLNLIQEMVGLRKYPSNKYKRCPNILGTVFKQLELFILPWVSSHFTILIYYLVTRQDETSRVCSLCMNPKILWKIILKKNPEWNVFFINEWKNKGNRNGDSFCLTEDLINFKKS